MSDISELDCIYPDCLIRTAFGLACEHSCPFEDKIKAERIAARKRIKAITKAAFAND